MQIARQRRTPVQLELTPLIDCVFLLLIFFMLSSSFLTPVLELNLPEAGSQAATRPEQELVVSISADGRTFINKQEVPIEELEVALGRELHASNQKIVTIRGDEQMPYKLFVKALEAANNSGAERVNVAHEPAP